jgi:hypothetical protein
LSPPNAEGLSDLGGGRRTDHVNMTIPPAFRMRPRNSAIFHPAAWPSDSRLHPLQITRRDPSLQRFFIATPIHICGFPAKLSDCTFDHSRLFHAGYFGTVGTAWDGCGTVARVRIARVYRVWDGGTAKNTPYPPTPASLLVIAPRDGGTSDRRRILTIDSR